jgi:hypothetical protein
MASAPVVTTLSPQAIPLPARSQLYNICGRHSSVSTDGQKAPHGQLKACRRKKTPAATVRTWSRFCLEIAA